MGKYVFDFGNGPVEIETTPGVYKDPIIEEGEFSTDYSWWRIKEVNGKYMFRCLSGALAGGECKTEITKEEYDKLHTGEITAHDICRKYKIG